MLNKGLYEKKNPKTKNKNDEINEYYNLFSNCCVQGNETIPLNKKNRAGNKRHTCKIDFRGNIT